MSIEPVEMHHILRDTLARRDDVIMQSLIYQPGEPSSRNPCRNMASFDCERDLCLLSSETSQPAISGAMSVDDIDFLRFKKMRKPIEILEKVKAPHGERQSANLEVQATTKDIAIGWCNQNGVMPALGHF